MGKTRGVGGCYDAKVERLTLRVPTKGPRLTIATSATAARQRFLLNLKRFVWAAAAEAGR
jgi:hypothetical protein